MGPTTAPPAPAAPPLSAGRLEQVLRAGEFAVTAELAPPDSADPATIYTQAQAMAGAVDAINATDGSGAHCHMSSAAVCALLRRCDVEVIMQMSCRDRNRIAMQGEILGAAALGINNLLCLTGDGVQAGDHPEAKPVFDFDCMALLQVAKLMRDESRFLSGRKLTAPPKLFLGAAANPFAPPREFRVERLAKKITAGANFIQTQYCFDMPVFKNYMRQVCDRGLHEKVFILAGVGPLASARTAKWIRSNVPGVHIPEAIINRLAGADDQKREGRKICVELMQQLRETAGVSGVHIMAYKQEETVAEMVAEAGILGPRRPHQPQSAHPDN